MTKLRVLVLSFPYFADISTTSNPLVFPSHWEADKNKQRPTKDLNPTTTIFLTASLKTPFIEIQKLACNKAHDDDVLGRGGGGTWHYALCTTLS